MEINLQSPNQGERSEAGVLTVEHPEKAEKKAVTKAKVEKKVVSDRDAEVSATFGMSATDLRNEAYVKRFAPLAVIYAEKYGCPASISLGQGLLESAGGTSKMAVRSNNHFGMKCFSSKCRAGHCSNYADDSHKDYFLNFAAPWESYRAHSILVTTKRYKSLPKKCGKNYREWAFGLKRLGYATDKNYAYSLIALIERHKLYLYDSK